MAHLFSLFTWELSFGQTIGDKIEVLLGTFQGENLGESFGNLMGTHMEQKGKIAKNSSSLYLSKRKKTGPLMSPCWAFHWLHGTFIFETVCHHFWNGMTTSPKKKKHKNPSAPSCPKIKKPDPSLVYAEPFIFHLSYSPLDDVPPKFIFFYNERIWLAHHWIKLRQWRLPKIEGSILKYRVPPLWLTSSQTFNIMNLQ